MQSSQHSAADPVDLMAHTVGMLGYGVPTYGLRNESLLNLVREQPNFDMIHSICIEGDKPSCYLTDLSIRFDLCSKRLRDRVYHFYETNPSPDIIVGFSYHLLASCSISSEGHTDVSVTGPLRVLRPNIFFTSLPAVGS